VNYFDEDAQLANQVYAAVEAGEVQNVPLAAEALKRAGHVRAAELLVGRWYHETEGMWQDDDDDSVLDDVSASDYIKASTIVAAQLDVQTAANVMAARDALQNYLATHAAKAAGQYGELRDAVVDQVTAKIQGGAVVNNEVEMNALVEQAGREIMVADDRLAALTQEAEQAWRSMRRASGGRDEMSKLTGPELKRAEKAWTNAYVQMKAEDNPLVEADVAAPKTSAELQAEQQARIDADNAHAQSFRSTVGDIEKRGRERAPGDFGLESRFAESHDTKAAYKEATARAEAQAVASGNRIRSAYLPPSDLVEHVDDRQG
jgi:hypothetical protein